MMKSSGLCLTWPMISFQAAAVFGTVCVCFLESEDFSLGKKGFLCWPSALKCSPYLHCYRSRKEINFCLVFTHNTKAIILHKRTTNEEKKLITVEIIKVKVKELKFM